MTAQPPAIQPLAVRPLAVLSDIEGTTTPIAFVHRTLFPFARARLPAFLAAHAANGAVAAIVGEVQAMEPGRPPLETLLRWMDADAKVTPLKELQGLIWREGYAGGTLKAEVYPDVPDRLRAWHGAGVLLAVYSSGSVEAQKQLFGHTADGDLTALFGGYFDTRIGGKREAGSYRAITAELAVPAHGILFLSDVEAELDAAAAAGMSTCQLVRAEDGTAASARHIVAPDFAAVAAAFDLP
jgi:enolase-phosphatase E1